MDNAAAAASFEDMVLNPELLSSIHEYGYAHLP
jgi:hypothetical protein